MTYEPEKHQYKGRMPPKVWDATKLEVFGEEAKLRSLEIQSMAVGLSEEEVLDYYNLEKGDLPPYDRWFFECNFKRGRLVAKQNATAKLFASMDGNSQAIMQYLSRFGSEEWRRDGASEGLGKQIKIVVDD